MNDELEALLRPSSTIPARWGLPLLTLAALAAPALRTVWWYLPAAPTHTESFVLLCGRALAADPYAKDFSIGGPQGNFGWLWRIQEWTTTAESNAWPTAVMALGLSATLALPRVWGTIAGWVTVAVFVVIAVVFTIPFAVEIVPACVETLRFRGWDIVEFGPIVYYVVGVVLVMFLLLLRRYEMDRYASTRGKLV